MPRAVRQGTDRHPLADRGADLYETPPEAVRALLHATFVPPLVWEPCCGPGSIVRTLREAGHEVVASDLVDYGPRRCPDSEAGVDFFALAKAPDHVGTIVTNPPYKDADRFVRHALTLVPQVIVLLRLAALEGARRSDIIDDHLSGLLVFVERLPMMHRDGWEGPRATSTTPYAWFLFDRWRAGVGFKARRISWRAAQVEEAA